MSADFDRVGIIGLGLIGGSWGLALAGVGYRGRRVGFDRPEVLARALSLGVVDEIASDVAGAVRGATASFSLPKVVELSGRDDQDGSGRN